MLTLFNDLKSQEWIFMTSSYCILQTTIYCCLEESIQDRSGTYYSDCKEKTPSRAARSDKKAKKLWEMSEKLVGLSSEKQEGNN